ncbi:MAG: hypothetical protein VYD19_02475, partial [Myxococcota bacterium]|nr:hypothetical protein [Myxococcota bacterium]
MSEQRVRRLSGQSLVSDPLRESLRQHLGRAAQKRHRLVLSLSGESREACVAAVVELIDVLQNQPEETLWVGSESAPKSKRA